jgi:hypothetical protein
MSFIASMISQRLTNGTQGWGSQSVELVTMEAGSGRSRRKGVHQLYDPNEPCETIDKSQDFKEGGGHEYTYWLSMMKSPA